MEVPLCPPGTVRSMFIIQEAMQKIQCFIQMDINPAKHKERLQIASAL